MHNRSRCYGDPHSSADNPNSLRWQRNCEKWPTMDFPDAEWARKGATLSDKSARSEYGLTQDEIYDAIDAGKVHYRRAAMHGNPWLRLLRREVEDLARTLHGDRHVREKQARTELTRIDRERKQLKTQLAALEERRSALLAELGEQ
jgi:hypothetical protein